MLAFVIEGISEAKDAHVAQVPGAAADAVICELYRKVIKARHIVIPYYVVCAYAEHAGKIVNGVDSVRPARVNLKSLDPLPCPDVRLGLHEGADYLIGKQR